MKLKKFNQFNSDNWIGPAEVLHIDGNNILTCKLVDIDTKDYNLSGIALSNELYSINWKVKLVFEKNI